MIGTGTDRAGPERPPRLPLLAGWSFVLCAAIAAGYGLWALVATGESVASFDVRPDGPVALAAGSDCPEFGPLVLDRRLNPFRAVLRTDFGPIGSERYDYEAALVDEDGNTVWDRRGVLEAGNEEASYVRRQINLMEFEVERTGRYTLQLRFSDSSLDDLREATLELRGGIVHANPLVTWGFGLAAVASLILHLIASRRALAAYLTVEEDDEDGEYHEAA